jgi:hypothetical protein
MFHTTGHAQFDVAVINGLDVDVAPFIGTTRERFAAVLGSRGDFLMATDSIRALSSKTRRPALPPETYASRRR